MAGHGRIQNLKPFKPGQSGNPAGRAGVLPPEVRSERKKNQAALIRLVSELMLMTDDVRKDREADFTKTTQVERAVFALINKAQEGDVTAFRYLMELMTGKIPENDYDGFTEEDLRILNRVKEVFAEQRRAAESDSSGTDVGTGH